MKKYGKTVEEVDTEKMIMCREIVKEILDFGVDEAQKVIYLMKRIVGTIKSDFKQEDSEKGIIIT